MITDVSCTFSELDDNMGGVFTDVVTKPLVLVDTPVMVAARFDSVLKVCIGDSVENRTLVLVVILFTSVVVDKSTELGVVISLLLVETTAEDETISEVAVCTKAIHGKSQLLMRLKQKSGQT